MKRWAVQCTLVHSQRAHCYLLPSFQAGDAPLWVYFCSGAACLFYLHMDCLDGKQARKTNTSSPLGQLFDHGKCLDSVCVCARAHAHAGVHLCFIITCMLSV